MGRDRLKDTRDIRWAEGQHELEEDGLMYVIDALGVGGGAIVGVVGALQCDVIASRRRREYGFQREGTDKSVSAITPAVRSARHARSFSRSAGRLFARIDAASNAAVAGPGSPMGAVPPGTPLRPPTHTTEGSCSGM